MIYLLCALVSTSAKWVNYRTYLLGLPGRRNELTQGKQPEQRLPRKRSDAVSSGDVLVAAVTELAGRMAQRRSPGRSAGWEPETKVSSGLVPSEASLLGVWLAVSLCVLPVSLCVYLCPNLLLQGHQSLLIQGTQPPCALTHLSRDPASTYRRILSAQHTGRGGAKCSP